MGTEAVFQGGNFTEVLVGRADRHGDIFSSQTLGELKLKVTDAVFRAEM